jgi:predicted GNAT superfamily acetyltransferase
MLVKTTTFETRPQALRIVIRDIELICEMKQVEELQKEVWGFADRDVVPFDHLLVAKEVGGLLIGAFDGETLVGFVYGLLGTECDRPQIHSHMLAVKPAYRNFGLGYRLKLSQRECALARGIARVTWTFDPLQALNAHLNFTKLGGVSDRYKINYYGESTSSFLHQHGTDRLWVTWLLDSARVRRHLEARTNAQSPPGELNDCVRLVELASDDAPLGHEPTKILGQRYIFIEIPRDIGTLEHQCPGLAMAWRDATCRAFTAALAAGYLVEEFYYVFRTSRPSSIYVLTLDRKVDDVL